MSLLQKLLGGTPMSDAGSSTLAALNEPYIVVPHAKVGMPGAELMEVWDLRRNVMIEGVVECDAIAGWLVRWDLTGTHRKERVEGRFEIRKFARP